MKRMGMVIGIAADRIDEYKALHAAVWPEHLACISASHIKNFSIFLREPENLLFGYWEYHGTDFEADMKAIAADPVTHRWWALCSPCQRPLDSRAPGEHWASMAEVFHLE
jgi:L-rhamnose mutarotase